MQEHDDDGKVAAEAEIASAVSGLTTEERLQIISWGFQLLSIYGAFAELRQWEDLYQEAVLRTYAKSWKWRPARRTFVEHIKRVMWSIASKFPDKYGRDIQNVPVRETELAYGGSDEPAVDNVLDNQRSGAPIPERLVYVRQVLDRLEKMFEDDQETFEVLVLWAQEKTETEIAAETGRSREKVHAAIERIRYHLTKAKKDLDAKYDEPSR